MADQKQYDAALLQHQQAASAQQDKLQATTRQLFEVQKQLDEATSAAADARKQREDAMQLQLATREQLSALSVMHKVGRNTAPAALRLQTSSIMLKSLCASSMACHLPISQNVNKSALLVAPCSKHTMLMELTIRGPLVHANFAGGCSREGTSGG